MKNTSWEAEGSRFNGYIDTKCQVYFINYQDLPTLILLIIKIYLSIEVYTIINYS